MHERRIIPPKFCLLPVFFFPLHTTSFFDDNNNNNHIMTASQHSQRQLSSPHRGTSTAANHRTQQKVTTVPVVSPRQFQRRWNASLRNAINSSLYRYQIFITNPNELNLEGNIFNMVKKTLVSQQAEQGEEDFQEESFMGWWQMSGRKVYRQTLNQKRQSLSNNIKLNVQRKLHALSS